MPPSACSPLPHLLPCQSARQVRFTRRRRGCSDGQLLLSLINCFWVGGGHLSDVASLHSDPAALADNEPDRGRDRDGAAADGEDSGRPEPEDGVRHGVPAGKLGGGGNGAN